MTDPSLGCHSLRSRCRRDRRFNHAEAAIQAASTYCGVDFHPRQQKVAYCHLATGEIQRRELKHRNNEVRRFYAQLPKPVIVGLEATGSSRWFEKLLSELGHEVWIGNSTEIRRRARSRQKNEWRDAELVLDLMIKDEFPRIYRLSEESLEILRRLRYHHHLVKLRTMAKNGLQAIALSAGLSMKSKLLTKSGRAKLGSLPLSPVLGEQRREWLDLIDRLNHRIARLDAEVGQAVEAERARPLAPDSSRHRAAHGPRTPSIRWSR